MATGEKSKTKLSLNTKIFTIIVIILAAAIILSGVPQTAQFNRFYTAKTGAPMPVSPVVTPTTPNTPAEVAPNATAYQTQIDAKYASIQAKIIEKGANWTASTDFVSKLTHEQQLMRIMPLEEVEDLELESGEHQIFDSGESGLTASLPASFDWRNAYGKNFITPVKDQGNCGSCWAFAAVGAIEAHRNIKLNQITDLSEQEFVACAEKGCKGGNAGNAMGYYLVKGITTESCLPYLSVFGASMSCESPLVKYCQQSSKRVSQQTYTVESLGSRDISVVKQRLIKNGPLAVLIVVYDDFLAYKSGIYSHVSDTALGSHWVLIVGYNDAGKYWIVKNSWGTDWGESGYFKMAYSEGIHHHLIKGFTTATKIMVPTPFPVNAWGKYTADLPSTHPLYFSIWESCDNFDGGFEWADSYCKNNKIHNYTKGASNECYYEWSSARWKPAGATSAQKGVSTGGGQALTYVKCLI